MVAMVAEYAMIDSSQEPQPHNNMTTVLFTRHFTSGNLNGLSVSDSIKFVSAERAQDWINGIRANIAAGRLNYNITIEQIA